MAESRFGDLETRFRTLQPPHDEGLRANWISTAWNEAGDKWYLSESNKRVHALFRWAVEQAALRLGHKDAATALFFWLDLLRRDSPNFRAIKQSSRRRKGTTKHVEGGEVYRVCEASADYCLKLESATEPHGSAPTNKRGRHESTALPAGGERPTAVDGSQQASRKDAIEKKIRRDPKGCVTNKEAAIYLGVVSKTIRSWKKGEVQSRCLKEGAKRGTVSSESILLLERSLQASPKE
jgi:hypothetical protein